MGGLSSTGLARRRKTNKSVNRVPVRPNEELSVRGRSTLMSGGIKHVLGRAAAVYLLATVNYTCDERRDRLLLPVMCMFRRRKRRRFLSLWEIKPNPSFSPDLVVSEYNLSSFHVVIRCVAIKYIIKVYTYKILYTIL